MFPLKVRKCASRALATFQIIGKVRKQEARKQEVIGIKCVVCS